VDKPQAAGNKSRELRGIQVKLINPFKILDRCRYSAKRRIEKTSDISRTEQLWYKSMPRELREVGFDRRADAVMGPASSKGIKAHIHTHIDGYAVPSRADLAIWYDAAKTSSLRTFHIVSVNRHGKVIGYFSARVTKKFVDLVVNCKPGDKLEHSLVLEEELLARGVSRYNRVDYMRAKVDLLREKGFLKVKKVPMPGYAYHQGYFVRKRFLRK